MSTTPPDEPSEPTKELEPAEPAQTEEEDLAGVKSHSMDWPTFGIVLALLATLGLGAITPYTMFGLPLHSLVNHAAVVFIPALAITTLIVIWKESWRRAWSLPLAIGGVVTAAVTNISVASGQELRHHLFPALHGIRGRLNGADHLIQRHAQAAHWLQWIVFALAAILVAHYVIGRLNDFDKHWLKLVVQILATVAAAFALLTGIYVGTLGERAVSDDRNCAYCATTPGAPFDHRFGNGGGPFGNHRVNPGGPNNGAPMPRMPFHRNGTTTTTVPGATTTTSTTVPPGA